MRLIVTGATGFIGRYAVEIAARRGHEVHGFARREAKSADRNIQYHSVDLLNDRATMRRLVQQIGATHLLHLAWYTEPGRYWTSPENFQWVAASLDLADAFAKGGGKRLVGTGSCAEYDWSSGVCSENSTPSLPATPYGVAKNSLRVLLESWTALQGLTFAWARIFFTYGPREATDRLVSSVTRALLRGESAACSEGRQRRDFLYVADVADALVTLTESTVAGIVNLGTGADVSVREVVEEIGRQTGQADRIAFGRLPTRDEPPLIRADVGRLTGELAWRPRFDLSAGIAETVAWWRENLD